MDATTNFAASFGGGIRYYTTERLGFRMEFKAYLTRAHTITFSRFLSCSDPRFQAADDVTPAVSPPVVVHSYAAAPNGQTVTSSVSAIVTPV